VVGCNEAEENLNPDGGGAAMLDAEGQNLKPEGFEAATNPYPIAACRAISEGD
jgi:hypothetical protein